MDAISLIVAVVGVVFTIVGVVYSIVQSICSIRAKKATKSLLIPEKEVREWYYNHQREQIRQALLKESSEALKKDFKWPFYFLLFLIGISVINWYFTDFSRNDKAPDLAIDLSVLFFALLGLIAGMYGLLRWLTTRTVKTIRISEILKNSRIRKLQRLARNVTSSGFDKLHNNVKAELIRYLSLDNELEYFNVGSKIEGLYNKSNALLYKLTDGWAILIHINFGHGEKKLSETIYSTCPFDKDPFRGSKNVVRNMLTRFMATLNLNAI